MISISRPLIGEEEKQAVLEVLASGQLAQGERVREFEEQFAAYCGVNYAVATSSGTTALHLALLAHGVGPSDEVITTSFTFIASANAICYVGATPVFVDIDEQSFNIDPTRIKDKITPRTRAILPVHLYGNPCDMEAILAIAAAYNLVVIEDACQAHGACINGSKVGNFGTGCFSFYPTKNITAGEGGMITTDDGDFAERVRMLRDHGMQQRYHHKILGYNFRMTDIHAAIGAAQLKKIEGFTEKRITNADYYNRHLKNVITPVLRTGIRHVFHQYTIRVLEDRDRQVQLLRNQNIQVGVYYALPVHKQPVFQQSGFNDSLPVTERVSRDVISLPVHPGLTQADLELIVTEVSNIC